MIYLSSSEVFNIILLFIVLLLLISPSSDANWCLTWSWIQDIVDSIINGQVKKIQEIQIKNRIRKEI